MTPHLRKAFRWVSIAVLLLLGLLGTLFPIVPGFPFLIAAVALLAAESYATRKWLRLFRRRHRRWLAWMKVPHGHPPGGRPEPKPRKPRKSSPSELSD